MGFLLKLQTDVALAITSSVAVIGWYGRPESRYVNVNTYFTFTEVESVCTASLTGLNAVSFQYY